MHTIQEQIKLWGNIAKRQEFLKNYQDWGVWFTVDPLDLAFYKYDLENGDRIIALEYKHTNYCSLKDEKPWRLAYKLYIQEAGKPFQANSLYEGNVERYLKDEKVRLQQKLKDLAA